MALHRQKLTPQGYACFKFLTSRLLRKKISVKIQKLVYLVILKFLTFSKSFMLRFICKV